MWVKAALPLGFATCCRSRKLLINYEPENLYINYLTNALAAEQASGRFYRHLGVFGDAPNRREAYVTDIQNT